MRVANLVPAFYVAGLITFVSGALANLDALNLSKCGPDPQPVPRWPDWVQYHWQLRKEVEAAEKGKGYDLVFYGDSITEEWRGTVVGGKWDAMQDVPLVFDKYFASYGAQVLAIAGDETAHLLWRLKNGELAERKPAKVAVLLIGTNDFGAGAYCGTIANVTEAIPGTLERYHKVIKHIRKRTPETHIITLAVFPRGPPLPGDDAFAWPNAWYSPAIGILNEFIAALAAVDDHVHYLDCSADILVEGHISPRIMPDALHPLAPGMEALAQCLVPHIDALLSPPRGSSDGRDPQ